MRELLEWETHPVTEDRFDDLALVINPNRTNRSEAYPVDPPGRMDVTMAFVGTRSMFEKAGFHQIGTTDAVASRMPRIIMRRDLR